MKRMLELLRYEARIYFRSSRYFLPMAAMVLFVGLLYAVMPVDVVDTYAMSSAIVFFVMIWAGLFYNDVEDPISQQLLILKMGSAARYHLSTTLFLAFISLLASAIATVYPMLVYLTTRFGLYTRPPVPLDLVAALLVHFGTAFMGASIGVFFHPTIIKERPTALLILFFLAVVGFVKIGIHRAIAASVWVTWLFPPISDVVSRFTGKPYFLPGDVAFALGVCILYGAIFAAGRIWLLCKRKF